MTSDLAATVCTTIPVEAGEEQLRKQKAEVEKKEKVLCLNWELPLRIFVKNLWIQHDLTCGFTSRLLGQISILLAPGVHHAW